MALVRKPDQWEGTESRYSQLSFGKGIKTTPGRKASLSDHVLAQLKVHMQSKQTSGAALSYSQKITRQLWQRTPAILVLGNPRQENWEFKSSQGYRTNLCLQNKIKIK